MTTTVKVSAHHGVDVLVEGRTPGTGDVLWETSVAAGTEQTFHAHEGQDVIVRETGKTGIPEATKTSE